MEINFTVSDINVDYLYDTYMLISSISNNIFFSFTNLMNVGRGSNMKYTKLIKGLEQAIKIKKEEITGKGINVFGVLGYIQSLQGYKEAVNNFFGNNLNLDISNTALTRSSMDIDANGDCYPAAYLQAEDLKAGNIRNTSLKEIWKSQKWNNLRYAVTELYTNEKGCGECQIANICSQGCISSKYWYSKQFDIVDPQCMYIN